MVGKLADKNVRGNGRQKCHSIATPHNNWCGMEYSTLPWLPMGFLPNHPVGMVRHHLLSW